VWGTRDRLIPPSDAARFAERLAGSRVVLLEGLGHVPHEEDPVRSVAPVLPFVAALTR
jgi:pimeloyl-ACP methyl ester carboxylesterase